MNIEYKTIYESIKNFDNKVNELVQEGWLPYFQAMPVYSHGGTMIIQQLSRPLDQDGNSIKQS